jgi:hypothetical protein
MFWKKKPPEPEAPPAQAPAEGEDHEDEDEDLDEQEELAAQDLAPGPLAGGLQAGAAAPAAAPGPAAPIGERVLAALRDQMTREIAAILADYYQRPVQLCPGANSPRRADDAPSLRHDIEQRMAVLRLLEDPATVVQILASPGYILDEEPSEREAEQRTRQRLEEEMREKQQREEAARVAELEPLYEAAKAEYEAAYLADPEHRGRTPPPFQGFLAWRYEYERPQRMAAQVVENRAIRERMQQGRT